MSESHQISIISHKGCSDGTACAIIALSKYPQAKLRFCGYGKDVDYLNLDQFKDHIVYLTDFTLPADKLTQLISKAVKVIVIDHHISAQEDLDQVNDPKLTKIFNMEKAGCVLTWEYFYPGEIVPWYFAYIGDRDIWAYKLENSKYVNESLFMLGYTNFDKLKQLHESDDQEKQKVYDKCVSVGLDLYTNKMLQLEYAYKKAILCELLDEKQEPIATVWAVSNHNPRILNELGEYLYNDKRAQISLLYRYDLETNEIWCSLRSHKTVDCGIIAVRLGGGGHKSSSGISFKLTDKSIEKYLRFDTSNPIYFQNQQPL